VTLGLSRELPALRSQLARVAANALPGTREVEQMVHAGLGIADERGNPHPQLAMTVPTIENGLWKLLPDGRMELTWQINPRARWQDGVPFTAEDVVFTATVARDPELPQFRSLAFDALETIETPDPLTVRLLWRSPYIFADYLFSGYEELPLLPMPKHLLESAYLTNKSSFAQLPYWVDEFIGAGPFKLSRWERGNQMVLSASDTYVAGRPRVDEVVIRIIPDANTMLLNVISNAIEMPLQGRFSVTEIVQVRDQWRDGHVEIIPANSVNLFPQLRVPNPVAIGDVRFRRALLQALDRAQMAEALSLGLSTLAHTTIVPGTPEYPILEPSVVRYEHDPRQAQEMIRSFGYAQGSDGTFRDAAGERLMIQVRSDAVDTLSSAALSAVDQWQRLGIAAEPNIVPVQQQADNAARANFPGFDVTRSAGGLRGFQSFHSSQVRTPENRYTGSNFPGYANPEYDLLLERYLTTVPRDERFRVAGQIVHHLTDQLLAMPIYYSVTSTMTNKRLQNVRTKVPNDASIAWNAAEWDVQ
jgi:peptide/nickel transport system substrate-binding protein